MTWGATSRPRVTGLRGPSGGDAPGFSGPPLLPPAAGGREAASPLGRGPAEGLPLLAGSGAARAGSARDLAGGRGRVCSAEDAAGEPVPKRPGEPRWQSEHFPCDLVPGCSVPRPPSAEAGCFLHHAACSFLASAAWSRVGTGFKVDPRSPVFGMWTAGETELRAGERTGNCPGSGRVRHPVPGGALSPFPRLFSGSLDSVPYIESSFSGAACVDSRARQRSTCC